MPKKIVDRAKCILKGIQFDLELAFDWKDDYYEDYFQYFSDPDDEVRKWSLLIFAGGGWVIGVWVPLVSLV